MQLVSFPGYTQNIFMKWHELTTTPAVLKMATTLEGMCSEAALLSKSDGTLFPDGPTRPQPVTDLLLFLLSLDSFPLPPTALHAQIPSTPGVWLKTILLKSP